jgi:hypothetical protein
MAKKSAKKTLIERELSVSKVFKAEVNLMA